MNFEGSFGASRIRVPDGRYHAWIVVSILEPVVSPTAPSVFTAKATTASSPGRVKSPLLTRQYLAGNEVGRAFYDKHGFEVHEERTIELAGEKVDDVVLVRDL